MKWHKARIYDRTKEKQREPYYIDEHIQAQLKIFKKEGLAGLLKKPLDIAECLAVALFKGLGDALVRGVQIMLMFFVLTMIISVSFKSFAYLLNWTYGS
ncbi:hypothetical protein [Neopusillimonas maritima]|jgi:hypothetical protein|uniref:Uncharacterized protein n=1 Tax=Neopusillimonas maritima TaxID=2026239 RepID=A0ABX9MXZ5_9BURK|nr:hypothetical protein [Neopusillimonas maritima]RII83845.1 hypothetical protein CJO09_00970 [Neopusillimonas maritima]